MQLRKGRTVALLSLTFVAIVVGLSLLTLVVLRPGAREQDWPAVITVGGERDLNADILSNEIKTGHNRFSFALSNRDGDTITGAEVRVRFYDLGQSHAVLTEEALAEPIRIEGAVPPYDYSYLVHVAFARAGEWGAEFLVKSSGGKAKSVKFRFNVIEQDVRGQGIAVGEKAPASRNPTLQDFGGDLSNQQLTTDPNPDPAMYEITVEAALAAGKPFVVMFSTPGLCKTRLCGPMTEVVKGVRPEFAGRINFIHIEIGDLAATNAKGELVYKPVFTDEWQFRTEPWVVVVDGAGLVAARFEGMVLPDELRSALNDVLRTSNPGR